MKKGIRAIVLALFVFAGVIGGATTQATQDKNTEEGKVTLCHASSSVKNPYVMITVDHSAVIDTGKPNDKNKHDSHRGPVFDGVMKKGWGDIIPPFEGYIGLNWTEAGQAIWENDCSYPADEEPDPDSVAILDYDIECTDIETGEVTVTIYNYGTKEGTILVNETEYKVEAGAQTTTIVYDEGTGAEFTVTIDDEVYNETIQCHAGQGGEEPTDPEEPVTPIDPEEPATPTDPEEPATPVTPVTPAGGTGSIPAPVQPQIVAESLPYTGGANDAIIAIIASVVAALAAGISYVARRTLVKEI